MDDLSGISGARHETDSFHRGGRHRSRNVSLGIESERLGHAADRESIHQSTCSTTGRPCWRPLRIQSIPPPDDVVEERPLRQRLWHWRRLCNWKLRCRHGTRRRWHNGVPNQPVYPQPTRLVPKLIVVAREQFAGIAELLSGFFELRECIYSNLPSA